MALTSARSRELAPMRAFTLVELLVVIGIIAVLISILLPVMGRARESARTVKCLSNLRNLASALAGYQAENRDSLPWGFVWNRMKTDGSGQSAQSPSYLYSWSTLVNKYLMKDNSGGMYPFLRSITSGGEGARVDARFSELFQCPSVDYGTYQVSVQYAANSIAMPSLPHEMGGNAAAGMTQDFPHYDPMPAQWKAQMTKPARRGDMFSDNALLWDTPVIPKGTNSTDFGWRVSFVDGGQLFDARNPWLRYRSPGRDYYRGQPGLQQGEPFFQGNPIDYPEGFNKDIPGADVWNYQWGTPRFRHNGDTACNVAFADGSVRTLKMEVKRMIPGTDSGVWPHGGVSSEFMREMIMLKFPSGSWEGPPADDPGTWTP